MRTSKSMQHARSSLYHHAAPAPDFTVSLMPEAMEDMLPGTNEAC
jgi:hypothetical protein